MRVNEGEFGCRQPCRVQEHMCHMGRCTGRTIKTCSSMHACALSSSIRDKEQICTEGVHVWKQGHGYLEFG